MSSNFCSDAVIANSEQIPHIVLVFLSQSGLSLPCSWVFLESDFVLLWYKTLHSEVAWTGENAGKSEFTLLAAWLIILHKVLWCQNTTKIHINKQAKQGQSFHLVCVPSEWSFLLSFHMVRSHDHTTDQSYYLQNTISLFYSSLRLNATCDSRHFHFWLWASKYLQQCDGAML